MSYISNYLIYLIFIFLRVYKQQSRPLFPSGVPALYKELACNCWETDQHLRPSFTTIRAKLHVRLQTIGAVWPWKYLSVAFKLEITMEQHRLSAVFGQ